MQQIGEAHYRLSCPCGQYVHEIKGDEDGNATVETITITPNPKGKEDGKTQEAIPKKRKSIFKLNLTTGDFDPDPEDTTGK